MKHPTVVERIDAALPEDGLLLAGLRLLVKKVEPWTLNALLKAYVRRRAPLVIPGEKEPKTPRWVSEFWVILCLLLAIGGLSLASPLQHIPLGVTFFVLVLLCATWPMLRLVELVIFVIGWVFVHDAPLHAIQRSLLSFLLNLFEVAILLTTLDFSLSPNYASGRWPDVYHRFVSMLTLSPPESVWSGQIHRFEVFRFWFGLVVVLCVISSLAGGIVRRTIPQVRKPDGT